MFDQINFVAGRRGAVVEDDFYNKLDKLNVHAGKRDKILFNGACATHMRSTRHSNAILLSANTDPTFSKCFMYISAKEPYISKTA